MWSGILLFTFYFTYILVCALISRMNEENNKFTIERADSIQDRNREFFVVKMYMKILILLINL